MRRMTITAVVLLLTTGSLNLAGGDALIKAVEMENVAKVRKLIAKGANANACYQGDPYSALHEAVIFGGSVEITRMLLDAGANPNQECGYHTAIHYAAVFYATPEVLEVLVNGGADVNGRTSSGETPLHEAVGRFQDDTRAAQYLIGEGADVNAVNGQGRTPLMIAANEAQTAEMVELLLEAGANPYAVDPEDRTPLDFVDAEIYGGSDVGAKRSSQLRQAIRGLIASDPSDYTAKVRIAREMDEAKQFEGKLEEIWQRDSALPVHVRHDKYMIALTDHLKHERYGHALGYFDMLARLDVELTPSFDFYYGEALLRTGQPDEAVEKLYSYITTTGSSGEHYGRALELVNEAETE